VEVSFGGDTRRLPLEAVFGQPGSYVANLIPTGVGAYRFRFLGTIEGQPVDELFDSADGDFDSVADAGELEFPAATPEGETQPEAADASGDAEAAAATLAAAQQEAESLRNLAYVSLLAALAGLALATVALARGRKP
jgi:hypothetical protein